ncbi:MAG: hypothetical protein AAGF13_04850 [Pseudomonadota bacterium]
MALDICEVLDGSAWRRVRPEHIEHFGLTGPCRCPECYAPMKAEPKGFTHLAPCTCFEEP